MTSLGSRISAACAAAAVLVAALAWRLAAEQGAERELALLREQRLRSELRERDAAMQRLREQVHELRGREGPSETQDAAPKWTHGTPARSGDAPTAVRVASDAGRVDAPPRQPSTHAVPAITPVDVSAATRQADTWIKALRLTGDDARRDVAYAEVRAALAREDATLALAALRALVATRGVALDRRGLRGAVRPHVHTSTGGVRLLAWQILAADELDGSEYQLLRMQIRDATSGDRGELLLRLNWARRGDLSGEEATLVAELLRSGGDRSDVIRGLQGAQIDEPSLRLLLDVARAREEHCRLAEEFVLKDARTKPKFLLDFLLDRVEAGDPLALEALHLGVPESDASDVARRLRVVYSARTDVSERAALVDAIGRLGDRESLSFLQAVATGADSSPHLRAVAVQALRRRK